MNYFLLFIVVVCSTIQSVFQKQYYLQEKKPDMFRFFAVASLTSLLFFVIVTGRKPQFLLELIPYSAGFAGAYVAALIGLFLGISSGSMALTMLISSYSLIIPTFYGILFLNDDIKRHQYIGIFLLLVSLFLIYKKDPKSQLAISGKWVVFVLVGFIGNGMCSTIQKMQQLRFNNQYQNDFMILALLMVSLTMLLITLAKNKGTPVSGKIIYAVPNGFSNALVNYLMMILIGRIRNAILFPTVSAGGIVLAFIIAVLYYREKLSSRQLCGYFLGVGSIVILNL